jgi:Zn-dependent protease with chaperone function
MRKWWFFASILAGMLGSGPAYARNPGDPLKPGFNLFSRQQDVQLGEESAQQVVQKSQPVRNQFLQDYVNRVGQRLAQQPEARDSGFQFRFSVLNDPQVNAFALPGGPMFIYTGLLKIIDNEGELAGVMGHEMSHVILRHGTHEASKQQFIALPAALAGQIAGSGGTMLGRLTQLGIGLGANSVLLKFSRTAESEADALGSHIMAEAGYDPMEMAHLFQKLEATGGSSGLEFLSDHPNPGNRVQAIEAEIRHLPARQYGYQTGDYQKMKTELASVPAPAQASTFRSGSSSAAPASADVTGGYRTLQARRFALNVPANWQVFQNQDSDSATVVPQGGLTEGRNGRQEVRLGAILSYFPEDQLSGDLGKDTDDLISHLHAQNPNLHATPRPHSLRVDGYNALVTELTSDSQFGAQEWDRLLTVGTKQGLFYLVFVTPFAQAPAATPAFDEMVRSLRFAR